MDDDDDQFGRVLDMIIFVGWRMLLGFGAMTVFLILIR